jgi:DNA-binding SARP family transcriptional activator
MDRLEIRLLGPLRIRRADGSPVDVRELRTGKTADLLRLLAMRGGEVVSIDVLLEALWPNVDRAKGVVSLRTAASQIRRALRVNCIAHHYDGLALTAAWVDTVVFRRLAAECRGLVAEQRWDQVLTVAREACALYAADLGASDLQINVLSRERQALRDVHLQVLLNGSDAALRLCLYRDAVDFATSALAMDPFSEHAYRALMTAHAGIGEIPKALAVFEQCRRVLADELGADPSAQTRAVQLQLLTSQPVHSGAVQFIGREEEQSCLRDLIERRLRRRASGLILVSGEAGIGKTALVEQVVSQLSVHVVRRSCTEDGQELCRWLSRVTVPTPVIVVLSQCRRLDNASISLLAAEIGRTSGPAVVIGIDAEPRADDQSGELGRALPVDRMILGRLCRDEVARLATAVLGAAPTSDLIDCLLTESAGKPPVAQATLNRWLSQGLVVSTSTGLALMPSVERASEAAERPREFTRVQEQLSPELLDVLAMAAVLGASIRAATLCLLDGELLEETVADSLGELADLSLLKLESGHYTFRGPWIRDDMLAWLRPTERRRLHRLIADRVPLAAAARIQHWLAAGEPERAQAVAMAVANDAVSTAELTQARDLLLAVRDASALPESDPRQPADLLELIGDVSAALGRPREAEQAYRASWVSARSYPKGRFAQLPDNLLSLSTRGADRLSLPAVAGQSDARGRERELDRSSADIA